MKPETTEHKADATSFRLDVPYICTYHHYGLLGLDAVYCGTQVQNISKGTATVASNFRVPEDGGKRFLLNFSTLLTSYMTSHAAAVRMTNFICSTGFVPRSVIVGFVVD